MDSQWEADLVDLQSLHRHNKGYRYLFNCIDVLSKYAWVIPLKDKKGSTLVKAFSSFINFFFYNHNDRTKFACMYILYNYWVFIQYQL